MSRVPRWLRWVLVPLLVVPLALVLFAGLQGDPRAVPSPLIGRPMPAFSAASLAGGELRSADLVGRPMIVNFWASWCLPCVAEHAVLVETVGRYAGEVTVVGILYQDGPDGARGFLARHGDGGWPHVLDPSGTLAVEYGVTGPPESFFVDAAGNVRDKVIGPVTREVIADKLVPLIEEAGR